MKKSKRIIVLLLMIMGLCSSLFAGTISLGKRLDSYIIEEIQQTAHNTSGFHNMSWINTNSQVHYWNTKDGGVAYQFGVKNGGQPLYLTLYDSSWDKATKTLRYNTAYWRTPTENIFSGWAILKDEGNGFRYTVTFYHRESDGKVYMIRLKCKRKS